jgi:hypothetical protein
MLDQKGLFMLNKQCSYNHPFSPPAANSSIVVLTEFIHTSQTLSFTYPKILLYMFLGGGEASSRYRKSNLDAKYLLNVLRGLKISVCKTNKSV